MVYRDVFVHFLHICSLFMQVYNLIGIVRSHHNNVTGVSSVEVEFHDSSLHHSLTIPNQYDYVMATLTELALCLACTSGDSHGSQLCCVCFDEQDLGKEWTLPMPKKEEIEVRLSLSRVISLT